MLSKLKLVYLSLRFLVYAQWIRTWDSDWIFPSPHVHKRYSRGILATFSIKWSIYIQCHAEIDCIILEFISSLCYPLLKTHNQQCAFCCIFMFRCWFHYGNYTPNGGRIGVNQYQRQYCGKLRSYPYIITASIITIRTKPKPYSMSRIILVSHDVILDSCTGKLCPNTLKTMITLHWGCAVCVLTFK